MKFRLIILLIICFIGLQSITAEEFTLNMLVNSLNNNIYYKRAEAVSQMGLYDYKASKASLYPSISGSIPFSLSGINEENYTTGIERQENQAITAVPEISITQLLPTAGLLTAQIFDSISMDRLIDSVPEGLSTDPTWTNSAAVSLSLSQPVFFKGAFDASFEIINKTYENSNLDVLSAKNSMVINAVESFYTLKQAIFNLDLIQIRFIKDKENFKRINQEFEMGLWTKSELYQAKSILIKSEIDLLEAEQIMNESRQSIINNFSLPDNFSVSSIVDPIDFGNIDFDIIIKEVISGNTTAIQAMNILRIQKASLTILRKDSGPVLSLGGSYSYLIDIDNLDSNRSTLSLNLGLSGNFFDGGKETAKMESGKALLNQFESDYSKIILELEHQTKNLIDSISRYFKLTELHNFQEEAAQYELKKGEKDLTLGQITEKNLSELQINLENTKLSKQQNIININMLLLQLADLQGIDLLYYSILGNKK